MATKVEMVDEIKEFLKRMEPMVKLTEMKRNLLQIHENSVLFPVKFIKPGLDWIRDIGYIWLECLKIRRQCTEDQWTSYKALSGLDTDELTEVVQMNRILAKLRKAISSKNRPDFFKREAQRGENKKTKKKSS